MSFDRVYRRLIVMAEGKASSDLWHMAALHEAPVAGQPKACRACPMRRHGELEQEVIKAAETMPPATRKLLHDRWGCHESERPCAGMRRLLRSTETRK